MIKYVTKISKKKSIENQWNELFVIGFKKNWIYKNDLDGYYVYKDSTDSSILNFEFTGVPVGIFSVLKNISYIGILHQEVLISKNNIDIHIFYQKDSQILVFEKNGFVFRCLRSGDRYSGTIINAALQKVKMPIGLKAS